MAQRARTGEAEGPYTCTGHTNTTSTHIKQPPHPPGNPKRKQKKGGGIQKHTQRRTKRLNVRLQLLVEHDINAQEFKTPQALSFVVTARIKRGGVLFTHRPYGSRERRLAH